ncbi:MAG: 3-methyl-2-oxobutanoate hydroxymethyltransferase [Leptospiraceae bacterium]|nr:3-methyl-2-oxobutanoate hydroxymethyltransferase [Leptospiraceae bacterium]
MAAPSEYILALGTNVGDRQHNLSRAREGIARFATIVAESAILETWPILIRAQGRFLNQAVRISTTLEPQALLAEVLSLEKQIGRQKRIKNGPREIDIDIIWSSLGRVNLPNLVIPHPYNRAREWVRQFMRELKADAIDETGVSWSAIQGRSVMNVHDFTKKKAAGEKITVVTCYDFAFSRLIARTSVDAILVGDSLGNVIQGQPNTIPVSVDDMVYHGKIVRRGAPQAFIVVDMPFMSYQTSVEEALRNAGRIVKETGADAVKLEGGANIAAQVRALTESGIPVMGHLGLTPQSLLAFGGYKVQGKTTAAAQKLIDDAKLLEQSGAFAIVLEMIPAALTAQVSQSLSIPTIGIGAGEKADGQVLVLNDLLGLDPDFAPKFVRKYADLSSSVLSALENYAADVRTGKFPGEKESFS